MMKRKALIPYLTVALFPALVSAQPDTPGEAAFALHCSRCHGGDARGGESGPNILLTISARADQELAAYLREGNPAKGMPPFALPDETLFAITNHVRSLFTADDQAENKPRGVLRLVGGTNIEGEILNEGLTDLQLRDDDGGIHLLRKLPEATYREVTSQVDWATYNGMVSGNRYTEMTQIDKNNVRRMAPLWTFPLSNALIETTPLVVEGIMYVTAANEVWALDAGTGRELWHYRQPRTVGVSGMAATGANRGVAVLNDKVFLQTDHAHMVALDKADGSLLWDTEMADWQQEYAGISAPLIVDNLVIGGVAAAARGFIAAYDADTGAEIWRRWMVPMPGEQGSETWSGDSGAIGAGTTWATGTYDPELDILYWGTGNPRPAYDGSQRLGDNLYTDSVLALNPHTGDLHWHYQFTPHDTHDWDAHEPLVLVDTQWRGEPRKLLLQANRNGIFYVLDRTTGEFLLAKPFLKNLNWASGVGADGRPILKELPVISTGEHFVCPSFQGGANWFSTSFNPTTGLYYFQALERCGLFSTADGGSTREVPGEEGFRKFIVAMNIQTGDPAFEITQGPAPATASAGLLTTASGLLIFGENSGSFVAADAATGEVLWQHEANVTWKASPMTYMFDGKQYIGVATGTSITAFGIVE